MKYSLWNFRDWLAGNGISLSYQISDNDAHIERVCLDRVPQEYSAVCASVTDGCMHSDCSGFRSCLSFRNNRILFPVASPERILNLSLNMMDYYNQIESALYEQLASGGNIQELLEAAATVTGFPLAYLQDAHLIRDQSSNWDLLHTDRLINELLRKFKNSQFDYPIYYMTDASSGTIAAKPLEHNGRYIGCVLLHDAGNRFRPGDVHVFSTVAEIIRTALALRSQSDRSKAGTHPLTDWYRKTLFEEKSPKPDQHLPDQLNWRLDDYYQIACLTVNRSEDAVISDLTQYISGNDYCYLLTPDGLSVLMHLGKTYPTTFSKAASRLEQFCFKNNMNIGYSLPFCSLTPIRDFYRQSVHALSLCKEKNRRSTKMSETLTEEILKKCRALPNMQIYVHPDIHLLAEIEAREKEPLLETLYTYLILGRSASRAAQVLYIHRNTLRTRLSKIQSYLSFSIENYSDTTHILISLMIIKISGQSG